MPSERLLEIFSLMAGYEREGAKENSLALVAQRITGVSGASIALLSDEGQMTNLGSSNDPAAELMDLEITLREGPCNDACVGEDAVEEGNLLKSGKSRWVVYTPLAIKIGARSVFSFPVRIGSVRLGVLGLHREKIGELTYEQASDGYLMASVVGRAVLAMQAGAPIKSLAEELEREATFDFTIHQAAGMIAVQASVAIGEALVLLRTHAFVEGIAISELSTKVIAREMKYDALTGNWIEEKSEFE
jgi:hypothetical protein